MATIEAALTIAGRIVTALALTVGILLVAGEISAWWVRRFRE